MYVKMIFNLSCIFISIFFVLLLLGSFVYVSKNVVVKLRLS